MDENREWGLGVLSHRLLHKLPWQRNGHLGEEEDCCKNPGESEWMGTREAKRHDETEIVCGGTSQSLRTFWSFLSR